MSNKKIDLEVHFKPVGNGRKINIVSHKNIKDWFWTMDGYFLQIEVGCSVFNIPTENIQYVCAIESNIMRPVNE